MVLVLVEYFTGFRIDTGQSFSDTQPEIPFQVRRKVAHPFVLPGQHQRPERGPGGRIGPPILVVRFPKAPFPVHEDECPVPSGKRIGRILQPIVIQDGELVLVHPEPAGLAGEGDGLRIDLLDVVHGVEDRGVHVVETPVPVPVEAAFGADPERSVGILTERKDVVVVEGPFRPGGIVGGVGSTVVAVQPAGRTEPDISVGILRDRLHLRIGQLE